MEKLIGQTLNRYKIVSLLGEGGMGEVFKAHDLTLQRDVAIKSDACPLRPAAKLSGAFFARSSHRSTPGSSRYRAGP